MTGARSTGGTGRGTGAVIAGRHATRTRAAVALVAAVAGLLTVSAPAPAAALVSPELAAARLEGDYVANGLVTRAVGIAGEHRGQRVRRTWSFISPCPTGACPVLGLHRSRAGGTDPLFLLELAPGTYRGSGAFDTPVRCHGRIYRRGMTVPFTITVTITVTAPQPDGSVLATGFAATYENLGRVGHTPCFSPPSYDSARYLGVPG